MIEINYSDDFLENFELYWTTRKSLTKHIFSFSEYIEKRWFNMKVFNYFNIKSIWNKYFRVKFIPYRLIIKVIDSDNIDFIDLFKRKWKFN